MPERKTSPMKPYRLTVPMEQLTKTVFALYQAYLSRSSPRKPKVKVPEAQVFQRLVMQGALEDLGFCQWMRRGLPPNHEREIWLRRRKKRAAMQYYEVQVCGHPFRVRSEQSERYVKSLAAYVEQKMSERVQKTKKMSQLRSFIGDAFRIADGLFEW